MSALRPGTHALGFVLALAYLGAVLGATAGLYPYTYNSGFENSGNIPDGNVNPWSDTRTVSGITDLVITDVSVRLNVSGGYNGDLYCYLSYNNVLVPLLNRVGVGTGNASGYSDAGLNVTFTDGAANNIHFYQQVGGYSISGGASWQPDGRTINPVTSPASAFDAAGTANLALFAGMNPNGDWSLVVADVSGGGGQATVQNWGLDITAVPEPVNAALGVFVVIVLSIKGARALRAGRCR
jgi:subtilisin-like proprotein convertase family protein